MSESEKQMLPIEKWDTDGEIYASMRDADKEIKIGADQRALEYLRQEGLDAELNNGLVYFRHLDTLYCFSTRKKKWRVVSRGQWYWSSGIENCVELVRRAAAKRQIVEEEKAKRLQQREVEAAENYGFLQITSKFPGKCVRCDERYEAGAAVRWCKGVGAIHEECWEDAKPHIAEWRDACDEELGLD